MFEVFVTLSLYCPTAPGMNEFVIKDFFIGNSPLFSLTQDIGYDAFLTKNRASTDASKTLSRASSH